MSSKCEIISLFQQIDMNKQAVNELYFHIEEALDIWAWQRVYPDAQSPDAVSKFQSTLSSLPDIAREYSPSVDIFLGIQSLLSRSKVALDPLIIPLRIQVSHPSIEETFHEAVRHFEAGRWAPAMSLLKSQDAAIDVLAGLEDVHAASLPRGQREENGSARSWRVDFDVQLAMCQASQLLHTGDWHFKEAETGMAEDLMGRAQLAQDDYRSVFSLTGPTTKPSERTHCGTIFLGRHCCALLSKTLNWRELLSLDLPDFMQKLSSWLHRTSFYYFLASPLQAVHFLLLKCSSAISACCSTWSKPFTYFTEGRLVQRSGSGSPGTPG